MGYLDNTGLAYLWQKVKTLLNAKAPTSHASSATTYGLGTASNYGHVKLSDSTSSTSAASAGMAASPKAVKAAYDLANTANTAASTANTAASTAQTAAAAAQSTADAAMPKAGGTFTGAATAAASTDSSAMLRNILVVDAGTDVDALTVPAGTIVMVRK